MSTPTPPWSELSAQIEGELYDDDLRRILYATDASVYRELPQAVVFPRSEADVVTCVHFAGKYGLPITPRAGGTSLAGQAVGNGLVVDVSKHLRNIVEINTEEGYAIVEPGVVRDQLNQALAEHGYWFGPNTSTANRCTLGGMFGNNSCGSTSITVGSTREHTLEARVVLSDGSVVTFGAGSRGKETAGDKAKAAPLVERIFRQLDSILTDPHRRSSIKEAYPRAEVSRRNNGYALDLLARQAPYDPDGPPLNLCTLLAGSEGTLAFTTQLKVRILPLPPPGTAVAALHFDTIDAAMRATQLVMETQPFMCELMDDTILKLALENPDQRKNSAFVEGMPRALLLVEYRAKSDSAATRLARQLASSLTSDQEKTGGPAQEQTPSAPRPFAAPILTGKLQSDRVWALRAAGLGILGNMVGDAKAVACIEDTAVALPDLAAYIEEVSQLMKLYGQSPVYYAHAGAGELHLRPILNLKTREGQQRFYEITRDVAALVKKYRGSLSGEHGDGRVRGQFLPDMLSPEVYQLLVDLKRVWDPQGIFNPGKIVEAPPMNEGLRYEAEAVVPTYETFLDFSHDAGYLASAEKCNGSGDCRKLSGGAMCPSFRATLDEQHSTRGRANVLREVLTKDKDPFSHPALAQAMDLCLSCKACTSECPSTVDMTNLKAEYLYQKQKRTGKSLRTRMVAANEIFYRWGSALPWLANPVLRLTGPLLKQALNIAADRSLPAFPDGSLRRFYERERRRLERKADHRGILYFFGDEFVNYQDVAVGKSALRLWWKLGYQVIWPPHAASGRAHLSKGLLEGAHRRAQQNVRVLADRVSEDRPLVGLEPSAILGFRDEYPKLLRGAEADRARELAMYTYTFDEWLFREFSTGKLGPEDFGDRAADLQLHVHCHEKALGEASKCAAALSLPLNFNVQLLDSGCCGMAGSFGYEAEHYEVSQRIAEQSLLSKISDPGTTIVAAGTSCRHTVKDALNQRAWHPAEVLLRSWEP